VKREPIFFLLAILLCFATVGCVSEGGGIDQDDWNALVSRANEYLGSGNTYKDMVNSCLAEGDLNSALENIDLATESYEKALNAIEGLSADEGPLQEYANAWQGQVKETLKSLRYLGVIINVDLFNKGFYEITSLHPTAQLQLVQAFALYGDGEYDAAISASISSSNKYMRIDELSDSLKDICDAIGEQFVTDYINAIHELSYNALSCLEDIRGAAESYQKGDLALAENSIENANDSYEDFVETLDVLIGIESSHPNAFPSGGLALQGIRESYISMKEVSDDLIIEYKDKMAGIEEKNKELFE